MTTKTDEVARFYLALARPFPDKSDAEIEDFARAIMRCGRTSKRLAEVRCCRDLTEAEERRDDRNDERIVELCRTFDPSLRPGL